ncbi:MAG: pseudouridine synthase [Candidatus Xenolissoclinum pacificiensis L6]|uniref:Pseudouridine synthase n=1 Tax=Candidatus Xenolissoclinum pacificiensis L6 TaxID=1401685 RepID=W2V2R4_9RICK|nr:MAG: pseudouridine synthase [Candidatus Xenolissoclinum pacificiensis L6]
MEERIDLVLSKELNRSRVQIQNFIRDHMVYKISEGNNIPVTKRSLICKEEEEYCILIDNSYNKILPNKINVSDLDIYFEDEYLLVINKPANMVVHSGHGTQDNTLADILVNEYCNLQNKYRPGIVHRLDKDTTGLIIVAKNDDMVRRLSGMIKDKQVTRKYLAITSNTPRSLQGTIDIKIAPSKRQKGAMAVAYHRGIKSVTKYNVLKKYSNHYALLEYRLITGRTHQIRVHMQFIGCPIVGDQMYGTCSRLIDRQALHAYYLQFSHPITGKDITLKCNIPIDMRNLIDAFDN